MTKNGVTSYTKATATMDIFFPDGKVCCNYCLLCRYEEAYKRYSCRITNEWLLSPFTGIGTSCPLQFKEESNEHLPIDSGDT
jgi:hypothetical protein